MVSQIVDHGHSLDARGNPFPRRHRMPAIIFLAVLAVICVFVWIVALTRSTAHSAATACNAPVVTAGAPQLGDRVASSALDDVAPASLPATKVRVFNGSGQSGQATAVADQLRGFGYGSGDPAAADDPIYTTANPLTCQGQIRYGDAGAGAASAVRLIAPCTELVHDGRTDATVDLALGTLFTEINPGDSLANALAALKAATKPDGSDVDASVIAAARETHC